MLARFKVKNFKNFRDELVLDLRNVKNYEFNTNAVFDNNIIKDAICYGPNAAGKTSLGYAILDITLQLTDKARKLEFYTPYLNLESDEKRAVFEYTFCFEENEVIYYCEKSSPMKVTREIFSVNGHKLLESEIGKIPKTFLPGTEQLNLDMWDGSISFVKYVAANTKLNRNIMECRVFYQFIEYVNRMLFFSSLNGNLYIGASNVHGSICRIIAEAGETQELQTFLANVGIYYQLETGESEDGLTIYAVFKNSRALLSKVWSSGTRSLCALYIWLMQSRELSFMYLDEFDAFYHYEIAQTVVEYLKKYPIQVIFTSHNTNLMTNELLRPDCNFELKDNAITAFSDKTNKALRKAHNIPKMYKAGAFDE